MMFCMAWWSALLVQTCAGPWLHVLRRLLHNLVAGAAGAWVAPPSPLLGGLRPIPLGSAQRQPHNLA